MKCIQLHETVKYKTSAPVRRARSYLTFKILDGGEACAGAPHEAPPASARPARAIYEDLLIHGDSVYDVIDKADQAAVRAELARTPDSEDRVFLCRMNVARKC
ncbi:hypothetical protein EVAR_30016_1 [Eumeta japonica]|uniref:Uncharacterized protein n=1 Tax=Eumeta variegata TaxID=151549 RepID=A0A4C1VUI5_EUMVA|nr:hypothetical protein EVAR_30016_1 [Eumeta japonica]